MATCNVAVDDVGYVYASSCSNGPVEQYDVAEFTAGMPAVEGVVIDTDSTAVAGDPISHNVDVDEGEKNLSAPTGWLAGGDLREGKMSNSRGVAVDGASGNVFAANGSNVVEFEVLVPPYNPIDNPAIVHAVNESSHTYVWRFPGEQRRPLRGVRVGQPLTGYDNGGYMEVFRYDAQERSVLCASCNPTKARAVGAPTLPEGGLGLAENGSVFFNSADAIAPRDLDGRDDAYEYEKGSIELISTGGAPSIPSSWVDANGSNAYFFTRAPWCPKMKMAISSRSTTRERLEVLRTRRLRFPAKPRTSVMGPAQ